MELSEFRVSLGYRMNFMPSKAAEWDSIKNKDSFRCQFAYVGFFVLVLWIKKMKHIVCMNKEFEEHCTATSTHDVAKKCGLVLLGINQE